MDTKHPADAVSRIRSLEADGRIDPAEATALEAAYQPTPGPARGTAERDFPPGCGLFRAGRLGEAEFRARGRWLSIRMGVSFCLLVGLLNFLFGLQRAPWLSSLGRGFAMAAIAAPLFAYAMHLTLMRPAIDKNVRLLRATGPLQPIAGADTGQCPACRAESFRKPRWWRAATWHWILNPGLAVNELVLGQRIAADTKTCEQCNAVVVDCPHCHRAIDGAASWAGRRAFGHWSGLHCPHCKGRLATVDNALGWLVRLPFALVATLIGRGRGVR